MSKEPEKPEYFGKYILHEKFAAGGMAEVFLCRAPGVGVAGKFSAMKRILPQFSNNTEFIRMFKDEAKIALNLTHSNIVSIFEFGIENDQLFLVMDLVEGKNLRQVLNKLSKENQHLKVEYVLHIINQLSIGLDHAHRCLDGSTGKPLNIIHRDISPQNIMISYNGEIKIIDFGIAKAESQMEATKAGTLKGKFGYMSPEQAEGQIVDLRTDIFSVGIMLWEMLANERLFIANNEINTLKKIRACQVPSLNKFNPNIPPELEKIIAKVLHKDRNLRYQTAGAFSKDLTLFMNKHYPEFIPNSFSEYMRSVYGDEIQAFRNKLIEFSKMQRDEQKTDAIPPPKPKKTIDLTSDDFGFDNDNSFVPKSAVKSNANKKKRKRTNKNILDEKTQITGSHKNPLTKEGEHKSSADDQLPSYINEFDEQMDNSTPQVNKTESLEDSGMITQKNNSFYVQEEFEDETPSRNIQTDSMEQSQQSYSTSSYNGPPLETYKKSNLKRNFVRFAIFLLMAFSTYLYFREDFSQELMPIEELASNIINQVSPIEGAKQSTSKDPEMNVSKKSEELDEIFEKNKDKPKDSADILKSMLDKKLAKEFGGVVIQSFPSGAEIYINGQNSGYITPAKILVPESEFFNVTLKRNGFISYERKGVTRNELLKNKINATLFEDHVAYLGIDVIPSRNARVYINGKALIEARLPIRSYKVPAGTRIVIKAVNPYNNSVDVRTVKLKKNDRQNVILRLK
ncbi:MAG: serine/threonine protein kinase [Bdellovibrionaceae bacterium]|nr:serine/threonine protein kinase [Pseudobdellovibrionaceae bacterium]